VFTKIPIREAQPMKTALAFLMLLLLTGLAPMPALSETVTYTCRYDSYSDEKGLHKVSDEFRLVFVVDTEKQTAQVANDKGKFNVDMLPAEKGGLAFVEMIDGGKVLTTSIDEAGKSVHSRNIILEGRVAPSQYYGTCSKK
jgi:hypothetical protein